MPRPVPGRAPQFQAPREPRFAPLIAAAVYIVCALALVYPILGGAFLVNPSSDYLSGHAYRVFGQEMLARTGDFAQWNSLILGGLPFIAAQHGDIFYPTFLLREIMPAATAFNVSIALHLVLAGFFTYHFLRAWALSFYPALFGGVAYMLAGQVASLVSPGHDGKLYVSALTPLVLWMIVRAVRDGRLWAYGVLAIAAALCILSPHFQLTYYLATLAGPFAIYVAFMTQPDGTRFTGLVRARRLGLAALSGAVAAAIAAVHFLPLLEYIPFSPRGAGVSWEYATSYSMPPEELINAYLPQFSGMIENYWGRNPLKLHSEYIGVAVLILAGAAVGYAARRSFVRFWLIAGGVALLVAFGGHTPFYHLWWLLPKMNVVRAPGMIYFIPSFAAAVLAAVGLERVLAQGVSRRYLIGWGIGTGVMTLLAISGGLEGLGRAFVPAEKAAYLEGNGAAISFGGVRSFFFAALALATLWTLLRGRIRGTTAAIALVAIAAVDLWTVDRVYYRFSPPAAQLFASDPTIEYLQKLPAPGRTLVIDLTESAFGDPYLRGDAMMIHNVRTVTGHQAQEPQRWIDIAGAKSPTPPLNALRTAQFRRLANVKYFLTNVELPAVVPQFGGMRFERRVGPVPNAVGTNVWLYEIPEDNPAAWVVPVVVRAPTDAIRETILNPRLDLSAVGLADSTSPLPTRPASASPTPTGIKVNVPTYDPGHIVLELDRPAPDSSTLIVSENWYPGWRAAVDGRPATVGRVDHALIGVALPGGARRVELSFRDPAYERGRPITIAALLVALLTIVVGVAAPRRIRV